ncbi:Smr/MutS family protein [Chryseobacterium sp.]|uniref:Smr/MutS family protein n=1 Tax=Chryseobacterium sp. TaxID=1871047 RepID=UPI0011C95FBE|nr:Smr/MutS family protein [Chryseobacterium sp.]TXF75198.1 DNA mismatch repair protein [Chryseobacterium sp.]
MKIGDKVAVLDDDLKGMITSVKGDMAVLRDEHGFTHQYKKDKLVLQNADLYENLKTIRKREIEKPVSKKHHKNHLVLDLHFENLVKNPEDYDAFERIFIQKEKLIETMDFCRKNNLKKLEIIHGIGDGVLQKMVHDYLMGQTNIDFEDHNFFYHQTGSVMVILR